jgi:hypothetical protein
VCLPVNSYCFNCWNLSSNTIFTHRHLIVVAPSSSKSESLNLSFYCRVRIINEVNMIWIIAVITQWITDGNLCEATTLIAEHTVSGPTQDRKKTSLSYKCKTGFTHNSAKPTQGVCMPPKILTTKTGCCNYSSSI